MVFPFVWESCYAIYHLLILIIHFFYNLDMINIAFLILILITILKSFN